MGCQDRLEPSASNTISGLEEHVDIEEATQVQREREEKAWQSMRDKDFEALV
jgi:hypothetical protein